MWLLNASTLQLEEFEGDVLPEYAILSHKWESEEVSFKLMQKGRAAGLKGFKKIQECCRLALSDDFAYLWIDTCCIDKRSSSELSEAINSMYRWYRHAGACYVYLSDVVAETNASDDRPTRATMDRFIESVWFTRGWTLQELLAPAIIFFFDQNWNYFGTKAELGTTIEKITGIPANALANFEPRDHPVAVKMSWAAGRKTTRSEDRAYSLFGLFDINMPLLYGEGGDKAFMRLQQEIINYSDDTSIFVYPGKPDSSFGMLAATPDSFTGVAKDMSKKSQAGNIFSISKEGLLGQFPLLHYALDVYAAELTPPGKVGGCGMYVFVRWNFEVGCYERVILDKQNYLLRNFVHWTIRGNTKVAGDSAIKIGRLAAQEVTSTLLTSTRLAYYADRWSPTSSTQCISTLPGRFFRASIPNVDQNAIQPRPTLYMNSADGGSEDSDMLSDCLCIGAVSTAFLWERYCGFHPTAILRIAVNMAKQPVVLLSRLKSVPDREKNMVVQRECEISGCCWYMSPEFYAKQNKSDTGSPPRYNRVVSVKDWSEGMTNGGVTNSNSHAYLNTHRECVNIADLIKINIVRYGIGYNAHLEFLPQMQFGGGDMVYMNPGELAAAAMPPGWVSSESDASNPNITLVNE